jgi:hypothetical protein
MPEQRNKRGLIPFCRFEKAWHAWGWALFYFAAAAMVYGLFAQLEKNGGQIRMHWLVALAYVVAGKTASALVLTVPGIFCIVNGVYLLVCPAPRERTETWTPPPALRPAPRTAHGQWRMPNRRAAVVLRPGWKGRLTIGAAAILLGAVGTGGVLAGKSGGWFFIAVAGFLAAVVAGTFLRRMHLYLSEEGFEYASLRRRLGYRWADVAGFGVSRDANGHEYVGFKVGPADPGDVRRWALGMEQVELDELLPDTYGMSGGALADYLEAWWSRYGTSAGDWHTRLGRPELPTKRHAPLAWRLTLGLVWTVSFAALTCMGLAVFASLRVVAQTKDLQDVTATAARASEALLWPYRLPILVGSLALGLLGSLAGLLPGTRPRAEGQIIDPVRRSAWGWMLPALLAGLVAAGVAWCLTTQHRLKAGNFRAVRAGMTGPEVDALLGVPPGDYSNGGLPTVAVVEHPNHKTWLGTESGLTVFFNPAGRVVDTMTYRVHRPRTPPTKKDDLVGKVRRWLNL